ncbi:hypothetical protein GQC54_004629 [Salmonella enterica]|nr:hypothetical protein [Salmonella enterica]EBP3337571.1 hypothetical protein [Salmonella enterica subsp. enterica]EBU8672400.1 hypothetical protein [Salmonella enterica subsp. enterica serovar Panama]ECF2804169.1 hypothetical protein [Salmonella enterica subsp. enterica serovar Miami]ECG6807451.1 hypothetical protein [Salmonella enterica subsp. enterica serovar Muenchen]EEE0803582.1 hypothetical protein [Salmonella enterica subsp. enterica serovar Gaminara]EEJ3862216.1 hypothetical protein 
MASESKNKINPAGKGLLSSLKKGLSFMKRRRSSAVNNSNKQKYIVVIIYAPELMTVTVNTFKEDVICRTIQQ